MILGARLLSDAYDSLIKRLRLLIITTKGVDLSQVKQILRDFRVFTFKCFLHDSKSAKKKSFFLFVISLIINGDSQPVEHSCYSQIVRPKRLLTYTQGPFVIRLCLAKFLLGSVELSEIEQGRNQPLMIGTKRLLA